MTLVKAVQYGMGSCNSQEQQFLSVCLDSEVMNITKWIALDESQNVCNVSKSVFSSFDMSLSK